MVYVFSLAGALAYAVASVMQQVTARQAPAEHNMSIGLITHLLRNKVWVGGMAFDVAGYGLQILALDSGPLALVEPLFVSGLVFALMVGAWHRHRRLSKTEWLGTVGVMVGLTTFVISTQPLEGNYNVPLYEWAVFFAAVGAVMVIGTLVGRKTTGPWAAVALGLGSGFVFSLATSLTKYATDDFTSHGLVGLLKTPAPYLLVVVGLLALVISQSSFQHGSLEASLPSVTVSEPIVSSIVGVWMFHERINHGAGTIAVAVGSVAVITWGIILLARGSDDPAVGSVGSAAPVP